MNQSINQSINQSEIFNLAKIAIAIAKSTIKVKGLDIYIPPLTWKPEQQRFTMRSDVLTGNDTSGAAQVAAAHCPMNGLWTPQSAAITDPTITQPAALWRSTRNALHIVINVRC